jgi:hypothetical protein
METAQPDTQALARHRDIMQYRIHRCEVYDTALKTQLAVDLIVEDSLSEDRLRTLLRTLYREAASLTGFKNSVHPTHVGIYAYASEAHVKAGMGQWVAMLSKTPAIAEPEIRVNESNIQAAMYPAEEKFGISEEERLAIWNEIVLGGDRATAHGDVTRSYRDVLARKHNLTREQIEEIADEGMEKNWPLPEPAE